MYYIHIYVGECSPMADLCVWRGHDLDKVHHQVAASCQLWCHLEIVPLSSFLRRPTVSLSIELLMPDYRA